VATRRAPEGQKASNLDPRGSRFEPRREPGGSLAAGLLTVYLRAALPVAAGLQGASGRDTARPCSEAGAGGEEAEEEEEEEEERRMSRIEEDT